MKLFKRKNKRQARGPKLSIILMVYDMPLQALNTLHTLSDGYQLGVQSDDYEILVVENISENNLSAGQVSAVADNARYIPRKEIKPSPVFCD